jgi:ligand-binding sensor domain-containing protein
MKIKLGILFILLLSVITLAQQITNWKNYTNMQTVQAVVSAKDEIWAATTGGGFSFSPSGSIFKTLHRTDGLNGINLTAVTVDSFGKIWFGSLEGVIDVYNPADNSVKSILDIYNSSYIVKQITELKSSGDTIFVSTSYGISLIDAKTLLFLDTFFKFGSFNSNIQVNSTLKSGLLYACTEQGLAIQKSGATNLSAPESWNVYDSTNGLPSSLINRVAVYNGNVIAGTYTGLAMFSGGSWQPFQPQITGNINDLLVYNDTLFILSGQLINVYANNSIIKSYTLNSPAVALSYSNSLGLLAATSSGLVELYSTSNNMIFPQGPASNQFPSLAIDNNSNLWCASGQSGVGKGFYEFDGKTWRNYNISNTSILPVNDYFVVFAAPDNSIYFGSWGVGYIKFMNDSISTYFSYNTGMKGTGNKGTDKDPEYLVISGFGIDSKNNLWVLNYVGTDLKPLNMITPDNTWYHYFVPVTGSQVIHQYYNLVVDQFDTKWFCSLDPGRMGLFYFNENGTYTNLNDDIYGYLTTSDGLTSNSINSIVMDTRGDIWVGTALGVNIISNTESITSGSSPNLSISSVFSLREYTVNCLAVDPINDKWVGTNQGLILVNSDGTEVLGTYTTQNSPLLSNNIISLAIDKNKGIVYVGTDEGLTSFQTAAIEPKDTFSKLFMYPSPFVLKSGTNKVTIDGLISNCNIKIITIYGKLIKEFPSPGGRVAFWDGTDSSGKLVGSGVYLVVAYDQDGNNVVTGKIAVLRQ